MINIIQIYTQSKPDVSKNGIIINPISCEINPKLNGENELEMEVPIDKDGLYKYVQDNNYISVPTPDFDEPQLYKIYNPKKSMSGDSITANARHVQFDLAKSVIFNKSLSICNGQQALDRILESTEFIGHSDITIQDIGQYKLRSVMNVINGSEDDSFINVWGGEISCNNYDLTINIKRGSDRGIRVTFGYNLEDIEEDISFDDVITRLYPYSGDLVLSGNTPYVDSSLISNIGVLEDKIEFSDIKVKERTYDADGNETTADDAEGYDTQSEAEAEMIRRCKKLYDKGLDKITANYTVKMQDLSKTVEYKRLGYDALEKVCLGDTVHCYNKNIDIEVEARCISYKWDCINEEYIEIELGQFISNYVNMQNSKLDNLYRTIEQTEQNILLKVDALDNSTSANIKLVKDAITATVEGVGASSSTEWKLGSITNTVVADGMQSTIKQSSNSIKIAWNKISNYANLDNEEGLTLGNQDNGTYSKIGYDGRLSLFMSGAEHPYHCLMYEGSKTINCSSTTNYNEVSISLPSMFDGIKDEDIKVAVAVKKVYKDGMYLPYWFGAYGEISNGQLIISAMSAWRGYNTKTVVTDIDTSSTDGYIDDVSTDTSTVIGNIDDPTGGYIDVQYILMA